MANTLETIGREKLRELLAQCTEGQVAKFHRIYRSVDTIPMKDLGWAIQLCERTIANNTSEVGSDEPTERFLDEENLKTARAHLDIVVLLAQKIASRIKKLDLGKSGQREIDALKAAATCLREAETQIRLAGMPEKTSPGRPNMRDDVVPEVGMRIFAERHGVPEPAKICSLVGNMYDEAWVAFEDGERARRRVDKLLKWTAPEEPCTCTNEDSDPNDCDKCRNDDYPYLGINSNA